MKWVSMLMLAGLLVCTSVHANSFILGGNFGIATGGEDAESLNNQLKDIGLDIPPGREVTTSGDIRTTWQAYITYQFLPQWGVELAYVDLGKATVDFSGINETIEEVIDKIEIANLQPRSAQGAKLSLTYRFQLNKSLHLQSKLGVFSWQTEYTFSGLDADGSTLSKTVNLNDVDVSLGLGLVHKLTNETSAHLDWDFYTIDGEVINTFTFGASYMFK